MRKRLVALLIPLGVTLANPSWALVGQASIIDGDTPESRQTCDRGGKAWRCGQQAALALADKIRRRPIHCQERDRDRYRRIVAVCYLGGEDLNGWLVRQGWALDYRQYSKGRYAAEEAEARAAIRGVWAGTFQKPWEWRQDQASTKKRATESESASTACRIKGNISSRGDRIYHLPSGQFYSQTRIDPSKGERWFCTEADAQAAGWRRSRR